MLATGTSKAPSIPIHRYLGLCLNLSVLDRRSNIRRGWSMRHSVRRSLVGRIKLNANFRYSADDFGVLLVEQGAQIVEEDNADYSLGTGMSYRPLDTLILGMNYSYRLDRKWSLNYTSDGVVRELERRNPHRTLRANVDYRRMSLLHMRFVAKAVKGSFLRSINSFRRCRRRRMIDRTSRNWVRFEIDVQILHCSADSSTRSVWQD